MWNENNTGDETLETNNNLSNEVDSTENEIQESHTYNEETPSSNVESESDNTINISADSSGDIVIEETLTSDSVYESADKENNNVYSNNTTDYQSSNYSSYHIYESPNNFHEDNKKNKQNKKIGFVGKALVAGLAFGVAAFGTLYAASLFFPIRTEVKTVQQTTTKTTTPITTSSASNTSTYEIAQVVKEVMPAVVSINCSTTTVYNSFFGQQEYEATSAGTGIIVGSNDTELLIATNNHVINGANSISISFDDESTATAVLKGSSSDVDLAVVAVKWEDLNEETKSAIKIATLGDSESLIVGEPAIAIGNSLGYGQSVTYGIISALNREVTVSTDETYGYGNSQEVTSELIQTDAAINPGNSGGPLLNSKGEVIGINSVKYSSEEVEGMGYAIPISEALPILEDLMSRETKEKVDTDKASYLGITGTNITSDASMIYGMPSGVFVASLVEDGPAEKCGVKRGDIITKLDKTNITSMDDLTEELLYHEAGKTIEIVVNRSTNGEYEEITLEITLGAKADAPEESSNNNTSKKD